MQLVRALPRELRASVATHSPAIAMELMDHPAIEVILLGGRLFRHSAVAVGDYEEACVKRALCKAAAETIVLASSENLATASPYRAVGLAEITGIVLPAATPDELLAPYRERGIAMTLA